MKKQPIILESNQNHATITNNGICPTLPASMGMGGGYVPMVLVGKNEDGKIVVEVRNEKDDSKGATCGGGSEVLVIANSSGGCVAGTLDASYFKGQGERQNKEREYVVVRNDSRPSDTKD